MLLFLDKPGRTSGSAELLNQLQLDGSLLALAEGAHARKSGFCRIAVAHYNADCLCDLREATAHPKPLLVGPDNRPPVFILGKKPAPRNRETEEGGLSYNSYFGNDAGFIYSGPRPF